MEQALERMRGLLGTAIDWTRLAGLAAGGVGGRAGAAALGDGGELRRGAGAGARGQLELRQDGAFQPIWLQAGERGRRRA